MTLQSCNYNLRTYLVRFKFCNHVCCSRRPLSISVHGHRKKCSATSPSLPTVLREYPETLVRYRKTKSTTNCRHPKNSNRWSHISKRSCSFRFIQWIPFKKKIHEQRTILFSDSRRKSSKSTYLAGVLTVWARLGDLCRTLNMKRLLDDGKAEGREARGGTRLPEPIKKNWRPSSGTVV